MATLGSIHAEQMRRQKQTQRSEQARAKIREGFDDLYQQTTKLLARANEQADTAEAALRQAREEIAMLARQIDRLNRRSIVASGQPDPGRGAA